MRLAITRSWMRVSRLVMAIIRSRVAYPFARHSASSLVQERRRRQRCRPASPPRPRPLLFPIARVLVYQPPATRIGEAMIVNLNKFKKQRERAEDERRAAENRVRFGRSKAARAKDLREQEQAEKSLEDKRLD